MIKINSEMSTLDSTQHGIDQQLTVDYSVMQSDGNSFDGDVVSDSFHMV